MAVSPHWWLCSYDPINEHTGSRPREHPRQQLDSADRALLTSPSFQRALTSSRFRLVTVHDPASLVCSLPMAAFIPSVASTSCRHAVRLTRSVTRAPPLGAGLAAAAPGGRAAAPRRPPPPAGRAVRFATTSAAAVAAGDKAPDFTATDSAGTTFALSALTPGRPVVLYFFPKSFTPGCTKQAAAFQAAADELGRLDAEVIGISGDDRQAEFKKSMGLTFRLVSDADGSLRKLYGVPSTFGILPGRVTYVIDAGGMVVKTINSQLDIGSHVKESIKALEAAAK